MPGKNPTLAELKEQALAERNKIISQLGLDKDAAAVFKFKPNGDAKYSPTASGQHREILKTADERGISSLNKQQTTKLLEVLGVVEYEITRHNGSNEDDSDEDGSDNDEATSHSIKVKPVRTILRLNPPRNLPAKTNQPKVAGKFPMQPTTAVHEPHTSTGSNKRPRTPSKGTEEEVAQVPKRRGVEMPGPGGMDDDGDEFGSQDRRSLVNNELEAEEQVHENLSITSPRNPTIEDVPQTISPLTTLHGAEPGLFPGLHLQGGGGSHGGNTPKTLHGTGVGMSQGIQSAVGNAMPGDGARDPIMLLPSADEVTNQLSYFSNIYTHAQTFLMEKQGEINAMTQKFEDQDNKCKALEMQLGEAQTKSAKLEAEVAEKNEHITALSVELDRGKEENVKLKNQLKEKTVLYDQLAQVTKLFVGQVVPLVEKENPQE